ncbi:MAG: zinc ribbon domain-containing protein [Thermoplasmatota archaeon]
MARLRCPKCGTVVEQFGASAPVCPNCGFGEEGSRLPEQAGIDLVNPRRLGKADPNAPQGPTGPVGRPRSFQRALLMSVWTTPVAGIFYYHLAWRELDVQFGRPPRIGWSVWAGLAWALAVGAAATWGLQAWLAPNANLQFLWLVLAAALLGLAQLFLIIQLAYGIERLKDDRAYYGIEGGLKPAWVYAASTVGVLVVIGPFLALDHIRRNVNRIQASIYRGYRAPMPAWMERAYPPEPTPADEAPITAEPAPEAAIDLGEPPIEGT